MWMQVDMRVEPEGLGRLFGDVTPDNRSFRALLARLNTQRAMGLPSEFFGYEAPGRPAHGQRAIVISTYLNGLRLQAFGSDAVQKLGGWAPVVHSHLIREANALLRMDVRQGEHLLQMTPFGRRYFLPSFVVGTDQHGSYWHRAFDEVRDGKGSWIEVTGDRIGNRIARGLWSQAQFMVAQGDRLTDADGEDGNFEDWIAEASLPDFTKRLGVEIFNVQGARFIRVDKDNPGKKRHFSVCLRGIEFTMKADLAGVWYSGRGVSKGDGWVVPATRAWAIDKAAA